MGTGDDRPAHGSVARTLAGRPAWATSRVLLPADSPVTAWRDLLTGAVVTPTRTASEPWMSLAELFQAVPLAVLVPDVG